MLWGRFQVAALVLAPFMTVHLPSVLDPPCSSNLGLSGEYLVNVIYFLGLGIVTGSCRHGKGPVSFVRQPHLVPHVTAELATS